MPGSEQGGARNRAGKRWRYVKEKERMNRRDRARTIGDLFRGQSRGDAAHREKLPAGCYRDGVEVPQRMSRDESEVREKRGLLMKRSLRKVKLERLSAEGEVGGAAGRRCHVRPNLSIRR